MRAAGAATRRRKAGNLPVVLRARLVATFFAILLLLPATAAANRQAVFADCEPDDRIDQTHSQADLRAALSSIPADVDQYTECRAAITGALRGGGLAGPGGAGVATGGSWGGSPIPGVDPGVDPLATATPVEKAAIASAAKTGAAPITIDGRPIYPSELGTSGLSDPTDLPTPLLAVLALLALGAAAAATRWSVSNVRKRRATR